MGELLRPYPTEKGIAVAPYEIWLPETRLNPENKRHRNMHHAEYTARSFGKCALFNTLRNLECQQHLMMLDQHQWIHDEYDVPKMPTPLQAISFIEEQMNNGGMMQIKKDGKYIRKEIDAYIWSQALRSYGQLIKD